MAIIATRKSLKVAFNEFFDCFLDIDIYLNIIKYLNIAKYIFEIIYLRIKDKS